MWECRQQVLAVQEVEEQIPFGSAPQIARVGADFAIRVPEEPSKVRCSRCGTSFRAAGPTGYDAEHPICDLCFLDVAQELGMLLALASVNRAFANLEATDAEEVAKGLQEVGKFARVYELVAKRSGPPRVLGRKPWGQREAVDTSGGDLKTPPDA